MKKWLFVFGTLRESLTIFPHMFQIMTEQWLLLFLLVLTNNYITEFKQIQYMAIIVNTRLRMIYDCVHFVIHLIVLLGM